MEWIVEAETLKDLIDGRFSAESRPLVRCRDCKYREGSACDYSAVWVRDNGYCQWGERREG